MSDSDDLESALLLAAAESDSRNIQPEIEEKTEEFIEEVVEQKSSPKTLKRKTPETAEEPSTKLLHSNEGFAKVVAYHYNQLEEKGQAERSKSRIVHLRNFHNWIKSMLISEFISKIRGSKYNEPIRVLDLGCGKGGDLFKWQKANIKHLICSDIAEVSLEQCKQRYTDMKHRNNRNRNGDVFSIEYIPADCTKARLREKYNDPSLRLNLVSCQFVFHYSFESLPQAERMFMNAAECLQPGGYFIGTMPDSNDIIARAKKNNTRTFGNDLFEVSLDFDTNDPPLFGGKYHFQLDGVVDCPEFLVHFPTFVELAKKYGLKLERKEKFYDFYERVKEDGMQLLTNTRSFEAYPPPEGSSLVGTAKDDYYHADEYLKSKGNVQIGTLSKSEWEASSLYLTFVFVKVKPTSWKSDGTPTYDI
ncbi:unnamed protein product [Brassicogethes aeneus]|uniref:mRNA cap guanine-N(7) methyltransferase n=1 Tax=Brassicogethes aeneus TaxID=1431903 RepID=A0A9P0B9Q9_BRAAE|nr:unnamed protein product [Brassicogethes aeneus]